MSIQRSKRFLRLVQMIQLKPLMKSILKNSMFLALAEVFDPSDEQTSNQIFSERVQVVVFVAFNHLLHFTKGSKLNQWVVVSHEFQFVEVVVVRVRRRGLRLYEILSLEFQEQSVFLAEQSLCKQLELSECFYYSDGIKLVHELLFCLCHQEVRLNVMLLSVF